MMLPGRIGRADGIPRTTRNSQTAAGHAVEAMRIPRSKARRKVISRARTPASIRHCAKQAARSSLTKGEHKSEMRFGKLGHCPLATLRVGFRSENSLAEPN